jgi:hypothetical protein
MVFENRLEAAEVAGSVEREPFAAFNPVYLGRESRGLA